MIGLLVVASSVAHGAPRLGGHADTRTLGVAAATTRAVVPGGPWATTDLRWAGASVQLEGTYGAGQLTAYAGHAWGSTEVDDFVGTQFHEFVFGARVGVTLLSLDDVDPRGPDLLELSVGPGILLRGPGGGGGGMRSDITVPRELIFAPGGAFPTVWARYRAWLLGPVGLDLTAEVPLPVRQYGWAPTASLAVVFAHRGNRPHGASARR